MKNTVYPPPTANNAAQESEVVAEVVGPDEVYVSVEPTSQNKFGPPRRVIVASFNDSDVVCEEIDDEVCISVEPVPKIQPSSQIAEGGGFNELLEEKEGLIELGQYHVARLREEVEDLKKEVKRLKWALRSR